jgi:hypothetical protein
MHIQFIDIFNSLNCNMPIEIVFLVHRGCFSRASLPRLFTMIRVACLDRSCHSHQQCRRIIPPDTYSIARTSFTRSPSKSQQCCIFGPLRSVFGRDVNLTVLGTHYPEPGPVPTTRRPGSCNPSSRSSCASSWECQLAGGRRVGIEPIL